MTGHRQSARGGGSIIESRVAQSCRRQAGCCRRKCRARESKNMRISRESLTGLSTAETCRRVKRAALVSKNRVHRMTHPAESLQSPRCLTDGAEPPRKHHKFDNAEMSHFWDNAFRVVGKQEGDVMVAHRTQCDPRALTSLEHMTRARSQRLTEELTSMHCASHRSSCRARRRGKWSTVHAAHGPPGSVVCGSTE